MPIYWSNGFDRYGLRNAELQVLAAYCASDVEFYSGSQWNKEPTVTPEEVGISECNITEGWVLINGRMVKND